MEAAKKMAEAKQPLRRLGRGLSSLMALDTPVRVEVPMVQVRNGNGIAPVEAAAPVAKANGLSDFQSIPVAAIVVSPFQPRKVMDEGAITRLADSIKRSGLMQPVVVRSKSGGGYELVAGERRWRAARQAGLLQIPALLREVSDEQAAEWGLVENVQREDLNPMERAWALLNMAEKFGLDQTQLADRVGMERSTVANLIRLTELEPEIGDLIVKGKLTMGHGKALLMMAPGQQRVNMALEAAGNSELTVRALEAKARLVSLETRIQTPPRGMNEADVARAAGLRDLERQIGQQLGTKVFINTDRKGKKGKISIEFYGIDHFQGLLGRMGVRAS
jgi:ParB family transcriptional regulator, chromosome partitioning protein